ncbi:hypothetical protein E2C01_024900 [Portunus trituberculatus]|uniref:Uncharacterized protein n=1 Tax=Portunus trituberculatus TaxID=210409 RepID=A0A5B7EEL6_PORTR|nr:hypothetical protein [Portunus trituberculatus]
MIGRVLEASKPPELRWVWTKPAMVVYEHQCATTAFTVGHNTSHPEALPTHLTKSHTCHGEANKDYTNRHEYESKAGGVSGSSRQGGGWWVELASPTPGPPADAPTEGQRAEFVWRRPPHWHGFWRTTRAGTTTKQFCSFSAVVVVVVVVVEQHTSPCCMILTALIRWWRWEQVSLQHCLALVSRPSEHKDLEVVGQHHLHKQVDWGDGIQGHLATPWPHQVGPKHHGEIAGGHLVEVAAVHHLQGSRECLVG